MKLKRICLNNIRSYESQEIEFPEGSVLLSGDIGAGKSTVLLALEFALFGLQTGHLSGGSLLRNNKDNGSVEIEFEIDDKIVNIKRSLKRNKKSIVQDKGILTINGLKEELGAEELKQRVLDLFGYPTSLIKAKTNLLYRFTVYTPQEEMKQILQENADYRIDVLRKIFGIDKYKKIVENVELIAAKIREEARIKENQISDLSLLLKQKLENEEELNKENNKLKEILPQHQKIIEEIKKAEDEANKISLQINKANELKLQLVSFASELKSKENEFKEIQEQITNSEHRIKELKTKLSSDDLVQYQDNFLEKIKQQIQEKRQLQKQLLDHSKSTEAKQIALEQKKKEILAAKIRIEGMDECPTCQQKVTLEHKRKIAEENNKKLEEIDLNLLELKKSLNEFSTKLETIEKEIENLNEKEKNYEKNKIILDALNEKKNYIENLKKKAETISKEIFTKKSQKEKIENELATLKNIDVLNFEINKKIDELRRKEREIEIEKIKHEKNIENITKNLKLLEEEITKKEKIVKEIAQLKKLNEWLLKHFTEIISTIEKAVMVKLNYEFNLLFEKWFKILVENLDARVDENFTPIIEQQGFEISYDSLSGGERTAAALAYRLALNQIINHFMGKLKTKGLLILDEPTDGFSSEQLKKLKDIFNELNYEQLIVVSHESEVEDFVENVINFEKKDGVTKVYY